MNKKSFLEKLIEKYTISNTEFEQLKSSYDAISIWLAKSEIIEEYGEVEILPQGSLALGTVVKPIDDEDDFDVDLLANIKSHALSEKPKELKSIVGDRLKEHEFYKKNLVEGKRCWTIEFSNRHADILPCVPDYNNKPSFISTEKKLDGEYVTHSTNPIGYKDWFFKQAMAKELIKRYEIHELTNVKARSNLQKIVQLCKLHRNLYIMNNNLDINNKPISIIISTLSAMAYVDCNDDTLYEQFIYVVRNMRKYIQYDGNHYIIKNPVNNQENFADKWITNPERQIAFFDWLSSLEKDVELLEQSNGMIEESNVYKRMFGNKATNYVYSSFGELLSESRDNGKLYMRKNGSLNNSDGVLVEKHTFYGVED